MHSLIPALVAPPTLPKLTTPLLESTLVLRPSPPHSSLVQRAIDPPVVKGPTTAYLQTSLTPSNPLRSLSASRKLLVLDLNGTLLVRSPRRPSPERNSSLERHEVDNYNRYSRKMYPRPYMAVFRSYLFATSTLAWLDTMVWSSAKPHNVDAMVNKCFREDKNRLVAVWARDTLGLGKEEYYRKTQTTKDLAKPWSQLVIRSSDVNEQSHESHTLPVPQTHSALTTVLLDDSSLKARLQPWNHVCIPEYVQRMRARDLEVWQRERQEQDCMVDGDMGDQMANSGALGRKNGKQKKEQIIEARAKVTVVDRGRAPHRHGLDCDIDRQGEQSPPPFDSRSHSSDRSLSVSPSPEHTQRPLNENKYDETLLAVIGILDALRGESNVAGWLRAGGLWPVEVRGLDGQVLGTHVRYMGGADRFGEDPWTLEQQRLHEGEGVATAIAASDAVPSPSFTGTCSPSAMHKTSTSSSLPHPVTLEHPSTMWFEHPEIMEYWVTRGRDILGTLGIEVDAGLDTTE